MKLDSPKDLAKVIAIMRKTGVDILKIGDVEIVLGANPVKSTTYKPKQVKSDVLPAYAISEDTSIHTPDSLSPDQLLFYSALDNSKNEDN